LLKVATNFGESSQILIVSALMKGMIEISSSRNCV